MQEHLLFEAAKLRINENLHLKRGFEEYIELHSNCTDVIENETDEPNGHFWMSAFYLFVVSVTALHLKTNAITGSPFLFGMACSLAGLIAAPLLLAVVVMFFVFREMVKVLLQHKKGFAGLLEGSDAYWALETDSARAIINILAIIDFSQADLKNELEPRETMIQVVKERLIAEGPKELSCRKRFSSYGYCYWEKDELSAENQVRWYDFSHGLEKSISEVVNAPIVEDTLWEVLVGKEPIENEKYPVLFRVHHCLGDGYALVRMFLKTITDKPTKKDTLKKQLSFMQKLAAIDFNDSFIKVSTKLIDKFMVLVYAPVILGRQVIMSPDDNPFHTKILSGDKFVFWKSCDVTLVKDIKNALNCSFTDVLLYSISIALQHNIGSTANELTAVIPARITREENMHANGFTVAMVKLPMSKSKDETFRLVRQTTKKLRLLPDFLVNYWMLRVACGIMPISLVSSAVKSRQSTLAISNVPGPCRPSTVFGNLVEDIKFWLPNRDTTGVGISILSYGKNLNIGISADRAAIPNSYQVQALLDRIFANFEELHKKHVGNLKE